MVKDSLQLIPYGEKFANNRIYFMLPHKDDAILIGTRSEGLFLLNKKNLSPFPTEVDNFLIQSRIYHAARLWNGDIIIATLNGGAVLIDSFGRFKQILNKSSGLIDENVKYIFNDTQGNIWLALNNGISRVELTSPISTFNRRNGLAGNVYSLIWHEGFLHAVTSEGLFVLKSSSISAEKLSSRFRFTLLPQVKGACWHLLSLKQTLLVATSLGVYQIRSNGVKKITENSSYFLYHSKHTPHQIWVGKNGGVDVLKLQKNQWFQETEYQLSGEIRTITESENGRLWFGSPIGGVYSLDRTEKNDQNILLEKHKFSDSDSLFDAQLTEINIFKAANKIIATTSNKTFYYNEQANHFLSDSMLGNQFANGTRNIFRLAEDSHGNVWIHSNNENLAAIRQPDGTFKLDSIPFLRIPDAQINAIYPDENGIVWFGGTDGLIRYDSNIKKDYAVDFPALVRRVTVGGDSVIYGGNPPSIPPLSKGGIGGMELPYIYNALRFEYAAPSYENEEANRFQYFLEGFEEGWSAWTAETRKDYTNLWEGKYHFRVRAKNIYQHLSSEDIYEFEILPPWYRAWWAYGLYALIFIAASTQFVRYQKRRAGMKAREEARKEYLQREVATAREMQTNLMPKSFPDLPGYEIEAVCLPAFDVGGDHYDYFWFNARDKILGIALVDVEGKRMKGAFPSVLVNGMIKTVVESAGEPDLSAIGNTLNRLLGEKLGGSMSVSLILGRLDPRNGRFDYINAGLPSPLLKKGSDAVFLQTNPLDFRPALGMIEPQDLGSEMQLGRLFKNHSCMLEAEDVLIIFSDGVAEVKNAGNSYPSPPETSPGRNGCWQLGEKTVGGDPRRSETIFSPIPSPG